MADSRPPSDDARDDDDLHDGDRRRLFERTVPDVLRKIVERAVGTGVETLTEGPDNLRKHLGDLKLPKEAASYVYEQIDDTKKGLYRVVAKEIRDVLEHMSLADEVASVLTKLSFEINTQIRFVPNPVTKEPHDDDTSTEPSADASQGADGAASDAPAGGVRRKSHFPRPQVVSKVVMRAVDMVTGSGSERSKGDSVPPPPRTSADPRDGTP